MRATPKSKPTSRLRKAWRVWVEDHDGSDILFAPSAGRARYMMILRIESHDAKFQDITVVRERASDVILPERHAIADRLSEKEQHCLLHAFGGNENDPTKAGYRDYFYTYRTDETLVSLQDHGLMDVEQRGLFEKENAMVYFYLTDLGKDVALSLVPEYQTR